MSILVGKKAPDFTVPAVLADGQIVDSFSLSETIKGKYAIVFFYPLDFTFVCPSEIIAMSHRMDAMRASFVIDQKGIVRSQVVNDEPIGRNMDELVRVVDALQFFEENGQVCPAGWNKGDKGMNTSPEGVASYLAENSKSL